MEIHARVPSDCAAVPPALHRAAVNRVIAGAVYAVTDTVRVVVAVRPRESVTVTVRVWFPDQLSVPVVKLCPLYVVPLSVALWDEIVLPYEPAAVIATLALLLLWTNAANFAA